MLSSGTYQGTTENASHGRRRRTSTVVLGSVLRILSVCLLVASFTATTGSPVMAQRIANGDFETVTEEAFDSWATSSGSDVASASVAPTVVGGNFSAKLAAGGGSLLQTVDPDGAAHFAVEMDFAVLDTVSTGVRSLGVVTYSTDNAAHSGADNIDSIRVFTTAPNRHCAATGTVMVSTTSASSSLAPSLSLRITLPPPKSAWRAVRPSRN